MFFLLFMYLTILGKNILDKGIAGFLNFSQFQY